MHRIRLAAGRRVLALVAILFLAVPGRAAAAPTGAVFKGEPQAVAEVQAAYTKFGAAQTWRAKISTGGTTQTIEFVAPNRIRMVISQGNETSEIFSIGSEMWSRSGGACQKLPVAVKIPSPKDYMEHPSNTTVTVTKGGRDSVDGTPTQTYTVIVENAGTTTQQKFHVAVGTGYPRRIEMQTSSGPTVIDYFDFGAPIKVDPPC